MQEGRIGGSVLFDNFDKMKSAKFPSSYRNHVSIFEKFPNKIPAYCSNDELFISAYFDNLITIILTFNIVAGLPVKASIILL